MKITLIVAHDQNKAIGKDGDLPWHLPNDLKWFKKHTLNHMVVMGRSTWESIPKKYRPLPQRINVVLTHQQDYLAKGAVVCNGLQEIIRLAQAKNEKELFITGGGQIYQLFYPLADKMIITEVDTVIQDADTHFIDYKPNDWYESFSESHSQDEKHAFPFKFRILKKLIIAE